MTEAAWSREEFEAKLREKGAVYHIYHPVNRWLNDGHATREQLQIWIANRWHYQISIPIKDAAILSNCPDRAWRRRWITRILDHDGHGDDPGGIEAWTQLGHAVGLSREDLESERMLLPGVRFAVDAYVNFARRQPWQEAVTASLTELFAADIHKERLANWPQFYPWLGAEGMLYFHNRVSQARRDVAEALALTLDHYDTRALQLRALDILQFKLDVLWQMNDAMAQAFHLEVH
jgi:pyrroloquinoline-quinone synthase